MVRRVAPTVNKRKAQSAHSDIMGDVQHGQGGLGWDAGKPLGGKASAGENRKMEVEEIHRKSETVRCTKAVSQA